MAAFITLGVMGLVLGLGLAFAADYLKVEIDERIQTITDLLPQYNCGACGFPGCAGFAEGIVEGTVEKLTDCKPGKDEHYNPILEYIKDHPNPDGSLIKVIK
ncbi:MAG: Electron transport complex protein rnfB [Candidatus Izimaplasma bacterium HR2]|nr:MAG: Electron transport complex protein rnfB [Candidatus Izimaplasma bacterium HR2]